VKHRELTEKIIGCAYRVLMAVCLCIALFAGNGSVRGQGPEIGGQSLPPVSLAGSEVRSQELCEVSSQETLSTEERFEYFNDFIIHLKDDNKKDRFLICDVVIELNRGMKLPQKRIELRKIIYNTLKELLKIPPSPLYQRGVRGDFHPSELPEIRRGLKEEIKISLNNLLDDEIIKKIYFTKFVLL
jgi:flagellar basal body-associated protein FliL